MDAQEVEESGASGDLNREIARKITALKRQLNGGLNDAQNVTAWVVDLAPAFQELTRMIGEAFGPNRPPQGACAYEGGCIVSSRDQCTDLGGTFHLGETCT